MSIGIYNNRNSLSVRTALMLSIGISLLINLLFIVMFFYGRDVVMPQKHIPREAHPFDIYRILTNFASITIYAFLIYVLNFILLRIRISEWVKLILIILCTLAATILFSTIFSYIHAELFDFDSYKRFIRAGLMRDFFISVIIVFSSQLIYLSGKKQQIVIENEKLLKENAQTRFQALRNQIDPHFLFNSLNTLNSLIKINTDRAQEYVLQLSSVFRYTLQNKDIILLREELKFTESYCNLMQIRFGENLRFNLQIDEKYYDYYVVPLSLQILVENAIKHNVISNKNPLTINITTIPNCNLKVGNLTCLKKEIEIGEGIGLANLSEQYKLRFQKEIEINKTEDSFEVTIPLIK